MNKNTKNCTCKMVARKKKLKIDAKKIKLKNELITNKYRKP